MINYFTFNFFLKGKLKTKGNNPFGSFPFYSFTPVSGLQTSDSRLRTFYLLCLIFACAAAKRAIGTRYGEQLT